MNSGIVAVLLLSVPSLAQDCSYTDADGGAHDISKLTIDTYYSVDSENYNSFKFFFNFCGPITFDGGDVCPSGSTGCCEIQEVGEVDTPSEFYGHADQYAVQWQDGENDQPAGPVVIITGDACPRDDTIMASTRLYPKCNVDAVIPVMKVLDDNYWECYVHISVETDVICATSLEVLGEDIGMIVCILGFVGGFLYFGIGFAILHKKGEQGWNRIPQKEFWESLPDLVKDGAQFSKEKTMAGIDTVKSKIADRKGSGGYGEV